MALELSHSFILEFKIRIPEFRDFRELENQNLEKLCFIKIIVIKERKFKSEVLL